MRHLGSLCGVMLCVILWCHFVGSFCGVKLWGHFVVLFCAVILCCHFAAFCTDFLWFSCVLHRFGVTLLRYALIFCNIAAFRIDLVLIL